MFFKIKTFPRMYFGIALRREENGEQFIPLPYFFRSGTKYFWGPPGCMIEALVFLSVSLGVYFRPSVGLGIWEWTSDHTAHA